MANEEITISELELADEVLADMVLAVDTTTDTRAVTLRQLKAWLGSSLPTGFIVPAVGKITDERFTLLDGKTLARTGTYEAFCNKVIEQVQAGNWLSCTEEEFNQDVEDFGQCGRFVVTNDYVRIPLITRYIGATITLSEIGRTYAESLPNITGYIKGGITENSNPQAGGAFNINHTYDSGDRVGQQNWTSKGVDFDASRSSSTYQDDAKVNPENTKFPYYMVVSTEGQQEQIEVDINEVYEDLNLKANTDLSNVNPASSFKEASVGWGMPDYSSGVAVSFSLNNIWTAPSDGILILSSSGGTNPAYYGLINETVIFRTSAGITAGGQGGLIILSKDDTVKMTDITVAIQQNTFIPLKGVN